MKHNFALEIWSTFEVTNYSDIENMQKSFRTIVMGGNVELRVAAFSREHISLYWGLVYPAFSQSMIEALKLFEVILDLKRLLYSDESHAICKDQVVELTFGVDSTKLKMCSGSF